MSEIISNVTWVAPFVLVSWSIFIIGVIRGRQRFRNSFYLMIALGMTLLFFAAFGGRHMSKFLVIEMLVIGMAVIIVPFVLMCNGIVMYRREGHSLANLLSLVTGVAILFGEISMIWFLQKSFDSAMLGTPTDPATLSFFDKICCIAGYTTLYFCFVFLSFMLYVVAIQILPHNYDYDYIIIHGCGLIGGSRISKLLSNRIDTAIKTYNKCLAGGNKAGKNGPNEYTSGPTNDAECAGPIIIPSGGRGSDESLSEAEAMKGYLLEHGISEDRIIEEDKSPNTLANLVNSKAIIDSRGGGKAALVSSNYHIYRCLVLAREAGLDCTGIGAPVALYFWPSAVIREFVAIFSEKKKNGLLTAMWVLILCVLIMFMW